MSDQFVVGPLPPGVPPPRTAAERQVYQQALGFEGVFTQHLVDEMMSSAHSDDSGDSTTAVYTDMENQALNTALVDGGGLGLAGALYAQLRQRLA